MCDTFVVVGPHGVVFGKNSDRDPNEGQRLTWVPRRRPDAETLACTWTCIPQVAETHAVLLSRPFWMWGAEMGANEHGVVIGNEAVFTRARAEEQGLLGMDLVRLGLERGASAAEAVEVISALVRRHGQGGRAGYDDAGFRYDSSFLVADATGAFVVETAGREVAVEAVRAGVRAISNGLTIPAFAARHGDRLKGAVAQCQVRRRRVEALAAEVVDARGAASVLRDHGAQGEEPRYHPLNGAMAAPCMHAGGLVASGQTVASWISHLASGSARHSAPRHWATGTAAPCLSGFKAVAVDRPVDLGAPTGRRDDSPWWRFEALHRRVVGDPEAAARLRAARDAWERWEEAPGPEPWQRWEAFVEEHLATTQAVDRRPGWVQRLWQRWEREAVTSKLPPWPA